MHEIFDENHLLNIGRKILMSRFTRIKEKRACNQGNHIEKYFMVHLIAYLIMTSVTFFFLLPE